MSFYVLKIKGNFYFRIWIPQDLQHHFPYLEIKRSLRTKCPRNARSQAKLWMSKAESVFMTLRANVLAPEQVEGYVQRELPTIWKKNHSNSPPTVPQNQNHDSQKKSKQLDKVVEAYMQEYVSLGKWSEKTIVESRAQLAMFQRVVGNVPVRSIDRQMMVHYLETLKKLPAGITNKPAYRDKTLKEILAMPDVQPMSNTTVNKYLERAGAMFLWCVRQEYLDRNPAKGLSIPKTTKEDELRSPYSKKDVERIMKGLARVDPEKPERYWIPRIGMYSGLRLNELCQLYLEDLVQVEGVWCIDINGEKDKRLKNLASRRLVPVHPKLIDMGLLSYVDSLRRDGGERLWGNLEHGRDGHSHAFSHWYQRFNRKHVTADPKKVFHSFRHLVADTLKQAGVEEGVIAEILGHANQSITTGRYGKRYRPSVLLEALKNLDYYGGV